MNVRILGAGIPAAIILGWLGWSQSGGDFNAVARAVVLLMLVLLAASGRNWARVFSAIWIGLLGTVAAIASTMAPGLIDTLIGVLFGLLLIAAAITIYRERPAAEEVA